MCCQSVKIFVVNVKEWYVGDARLNVLDVISSYVSNASMLEHVVTSSFALDVNEES